MGERARSCGRLSGLVAGGLLPAVTMLSPATAEVQMLQGTAPESDQAAINDVLATFRHADEALRARDVDGMMALYSEQYHYHALEKADLRKVWTDLFDEFQELSNAHHFPRSTKVGSGSKPIIEVTCTGQLSGLPKTTGLHVPIDSRYEEVHDMTFEDGQRHIRGNVGDSPRIMPFSTSPHSLL